MSNDDDSVSPMKKKTALSVFFVMIILLIIVPLVIGIVYWYRVPINPAQKQSRVQKALVIIELSISLNTVHREENISLYGKLSVALETTLQFWYRHIYSPTNMSKWKQFAEAKSDKNGVFAYQMVIPFNTPEGTLQFIAYWPGNDKYVSTSSNSVILTVLK